MSFTFTETAAAKVVQATKQVLGSPVNGQGDAGPTRSYRDLFFWANLSNETGVAGAYSYDFTECSRSGTAITGGRTTTALSLHATATGGQQCSGVVLIRMDFVADAPLFSILTTPPFPTGSKKHMVPQMTSDATVTVPGNWGWDFSLIHG